VLLRFRRRRRAHQRQPAITPRVRKRRSPPAGPPPRPAKATLRIAAARGTQTRRSRLVRMRVGRMRVIRLSRPLRVRMPRARHVNRNLVPANRMLRANRVPRPKRAPRKRLHLSQAIALRRRSRKRQAPRPSPLASPKDAEPVNSQLHLASAHSSTGYFSVRSRRSYRFVAKISQGWIPNRSPAAPTSAN